MNTAKWQNIAGSKKFFNTQGIYFDIQTKKKSYGRKMYFKWLFIANLDRFLAHFVVANTTGQISSARTGKKNID